MGDLPHQPLERHLLDEECSTLLEVANVTECCRARPVSVWLNLSAFHPCLVYLLQLSSGPVQYSLSQLGPFLFLQDVKRSQVPINRRVRYPSLYSWANVLATKCSWSSRLFLGQWRLWSLGRLACLPSLVGLIIGVIIISATLGTSAWATTTSAARTASSTAS